MVNEQAWQSLSKSLHQQQVELVAVSKTKPVEDIKALYDLGQRDFGENYVQELVEKHAALPEDIRWHYIGHLQTNKVKYIAGFVHLIHAVDSFKLLSEINRQAEKHGRIIDVLLQMHIASEETKFGMDVTDRVEFMQFYEAQRQQLKHVRVRGLMGMASFTNDEKTVRREFKTLHDCFLAMKQSDFLFSDVFDTCSMGMSGDYQLAIEEGSNMVRIGSLLFGARN